MEELKQISRHRQYWFWIFAPLIVVLYLFGLTIPLVGPDEPRYAQVAREMFERSDWVTPTLGGFTWFEKPALLYWLQISAYHVFGVSEIAARLGSAFFGLGTVASLYIFGRIVEKRTEVQNLANWMAVIGASSIGLLAFSRGASFDIILTFPLTAAMVSFFAYDQGEERRLSTLYLFLFYFFIGVAVLAKGLIGGVFPLASVSLYFLVARKVPSRRFVASLFWGAAVASVVAASWYLPMYLRHGHEFIDEFFIQHHFQRFASNKYRHPQPFYFFLWVLPLMTLPWLPFLLASVVNGFRKASGSDSLSRSRSPVLFLLSWLIIPLVFFSFSGSKLPGYILPALPPTLALIAIYVAGFVLKSPTFRKIAGGLALATLVGTAIALVSVVPRYAEADSVKSLIAAADERGYAEAQVVALHHPSHNAEFYAAGRLLRDDAGEQKLLYGPAAVASEVEALKGATILVLVPLEYLPQLMNYTPVKADFIAENSETAIVAVSIIR